MQSHQPTLKTTHCLTGRVSSCAKSLLFTVSLITLLHFSESLIKPYVIYTELPGNNSAELTIRHTDMPPSLSLSFCFTLSISLCLFLTYFLSLSFSHFRQEQVCTAERPNSPLQSEGRPELWCFFIPSCQTLNVKTRVPCLKLCLGLLDQWLFF